MEPELARAPGTVALVGEAGICSTCIPSRIKPPGLQRCPRTGEASLSPSASETAAPRRDRRLPSLASCASRCSRPCPSVKPRTILGPATSKKAVPPSSRPVDVHAVVWVRHRRLHCSCHFRECIRWESTIGPQTMPCSEWNGHEQMPLKASDVNDLRGNSRGVKRKDSSRVEMTVLKNIGLGELFNRVLTALSLVFQQCGICPSMRPSQVKPPAATASLMSSTAGRPTNIDSPQSAPRFTSGFAA